MSYEVRHDVPYSGQHGLHKYPWYELNVGSSFYVPLDEVKRVRSAASTRARRSGQKYMIRRDGNGYRCWRVA